LRPLELAFRHVHYPSPFFVLLEFKLSSHTFARIRFSLFFDITSFGVDFSSEWHRGDKTVDQVDRCEMEGYYNSLFSVNVVVVPLGKRGKGLETYCRALEARKDVLLSDVVELVGNVAARESDLGKKVDWNDGLLNFSYRRSGDTDPVSADLHRTCVWRDTHIVFGLVDESVHQSSALVRGEWEAALALLQGHSVTHRRVVVFNRSFGGAGRNSATTALGDAEKGLLSICPPEGHGEGGSMVDNHLERCVLDAGSRFFVHMKDEFAMCVTAIKRGPQALLSTGWQLPRSAHDELEPLPQTTVASFAGSTEVQMGRRTAKRLGGRVHKRMGDVCLLLGASGAAVKYYCAAVLLCKAQGDAVWQVGAMEGTLAGLLLCLLAGPGVGVAVGSGTGVAAGTTSSSSGADPCGDDMDMAFVKDLTSGQATSGLEAKHQACTGAALLLRLVELRVKEIWAVLTAANRPELKLVMVDVALRAAGLFSGALRAVDGHGAADVRCSALVGAVARVENATYTRQLAAEFIMAAVEMAMPAGLAATMADKHDDGVFMPEGVCRGWELALLERAAELCGDLGLRRKCGLVLFLAGTVFSMQSAVCILVALVTLVC
jgi:hypothetical protein